jgi:hypothetical protein
MSKFTISEVIAATSKAVATGPLDARRAADVAQTPASTPQRGGGSNAKKLGRRK